MTFDEFENKIPKRLFLKIKKNGDNGCWEWQTSRNKKGYGNTFYYDDNGIKHNSLAHRVIYRMIFGDFDNLLKVLHKCDNPKCCNPNHLWLGTDKDNAMDRDKKGRGANHQGSNHGMAVLNEDKVIIIKMRLSVNEKHKSIANSFGVSKATIDGISEGKIWKHVNC